MVIRSSKTSVFSAPDAVRLHLLLSCDLGLQSFAACPLHLQIDGSWKTQLRQTVPIAAKQTLLQKFLLKVQQVKSRSSCEPLSDAHFASKLRYDKTLQWL